MIPFLVIFIPGIKTISAQEEIELYGPIAHIEVEHIKIDDTYYFLLNGAHSYMHSGRLVEYEWHVVRNDTEEYYLYGPFQAMEVKDASIHNISLKVTATDTREDSTSMTIHIKDDGYGSTRLSLSVTNDIRLVRKLEEERTITVKKEADMTLGYIIMGLLSLIILYSLIVTIFLYRYKKTMKNWDIK
jgi:hypothetical protein